MVAVAASPTPGAAAKPNEHPPYKDMIVSAIEALKDQKGSSRPAILKYIAENYSGLPLSHSSLLSKHLRRLQSKGVIRMFKHSYKLADSSTSGYIGSNIGSKKLGRPPKNANPAPAILYNATKRRGRPPKSGGDPPPLKKRKSTRIPNLNTPAVVDQSSVYILPQAEQLKSGFLKNLPGAVAIILPHGLLSKKTAKSPVLILPNGVQSLVDASTSKKKLGRPRKDLVQARPYQLKGFEKKQPIIRKRKAVEPKQVLLHEENMNGDRVNVIARKPGRPRKINDLTLLDNSPFKLGNGEQATIPEVVQVKQKEPGLGLKKRSVGRPRKNAFVDSSNSPPI